MRFGHQLKKGDTIGLIGPSGSIRTAGSLEKSVEMIEQLGFRVKLGESCGKVYGYLSGTDEVRARDVNAMFRDDEVDAIICVKGGYGTMRMLDQLDYEAVAANPKIFLGYSDITAMHIAYLEKAGLVSFHGPMPASCWVDGLDEITMSSMLDMLMEVRPERILQNPEGHPFVTVNPGVCEGMFVGGNLSLIDGLIGTPYELDTKGRILFIEDIGEKTYRLDHMLTHLRLAGKFDDCAGVVLGHFTDCPIEFPEFGLTIEEVIRDIVAPCGKPVFSGFTAGHALPNLTLPLGVNCRMDADHGTITILESPVVGA
ncbi:MAG: LD-carboxypeptidase [Clostridia bacterium]|nr:LD-carboxypeptidase [Clostridia bacterium]